MSSNLRPSYRFIEAEGMNSGKAPQGKFTTVQIQSAWASSVYVWKFLWWTYSYPASNAIRATSFWSSAGEHKEDQVITWQGGTSSTGFASMLSRMLCVAVRTCS